MRKLAFCLLTTEFMSANADGQFADLYRKDFSDIA